VSAGAGLGVFFPGVLCREVLRFFGYLFLYSAKGKSANGSPTGGSRISD
jgi:hypothetical protein